MYASERTGTRKTQITKQRKAQSVRAGKQDIRVESSPSSGCPLSTVLRGISFFLPFSDMANHDGMMVT